MLRGLTWIWPEPNLTRPRFVVFESNLNKISGHMGWPEFDPNSNFWNSYPENSGRVRIQANRSGQFCRVYSCAPNTEKKLEY